MSDTQELKPIPDWKRCGEFSDIIYEKAEGMEDEAEPQAIDLKRCETGRENLAYETIRSGLF